MRVLLISTYDLGRQPFGLASPAAWLSRTGATVGCLDLAVDPLNEQAVREADVVAFYLPMHTATRLAVPVARRVRVLNPLARLGFFGLYAPMNAEFLRELGADFIVGGEFEGELAREVGRWETKPPGWNPKISHERQQFLVPDRSDLPDLSRYAHLDLGDGRTRVVAYTEASRGCKHRCRHCPVVPVYQGKFRIVQAEVVLEDIRRQVRAGAQHVTFGDPDFWNGIGHAIPLVRRMHEEHPHLTYDVTIKIEHLIRHREHLATLRETGCLFVTSAAESIDDRVLALLEKGHTRADIVEAVRICRDAGLALHPTFVAFTPWITPHAYRGLLAFLAELDLVEEVAPIQLGIRLLVPAGSRLLELPEMREILGRFDPVALIYPWRHPDPAVDWLYDRIQQVIRSSTAPRADRAEVFRRVWEVAGGRTNGAPLPPRGAIGSRRSPVPYLTEPWYC